MGNPKLRWTAVEEQALQNGVAKHGTGKWKCIQKDPEFHRHLRSRSNVDLKDKWRNMISAGEGYRKKLRTTKLEPGQEKSRTPKAKPGEDAPAAPVPSLGIQTPVLPVAHEWPVDHIPEDPTKDIPDGRNVASDTTTMLFGVPLKLQNGLEIGAPTGNTENYVTAPSTDSRQLLPLPATFSTKDDELLEEAAKTAAYKVAEAEERSFSAVLAVKEFEKLSMMQEEACSTLKLAQEIYDRCNKGEIIPVE